MAYMSAKTNTAFKTNIPLFTVIAFGVGAVLLAFQERLVPQGLWTSIAYGCLAASTLFGITAWRHGRRWPLIFAVLAALILVTQVVATVLIGDISGP